MPRYSAEEDALVLEMLGTKHSYPEIAAVLCRSVNSVAKRVTRHLLPPGTNADAMLTEKQVANMLGISASNVFRLINEGAFPRKSRVHGGRHYFTRGDVEAFVRYHPERYDPSRIRDPGLAVLAGSPAVLSEKLMTASEVANMLALSVNQVRGLIREGVLPGKKLFGQNGFRFYVERAMAERLRFYRLEWWTTKQAQLHLGYKRIASVEALCSKGKLRALKLGEWYIDPDSVRKYAQLRKQGKKIVR